MGKHGKDQPPDTNPIKGLFRKTEPRHGGDGTEDVPPPHEVEPIEQTDGDGWPVSPYAVGWEDPPPTTVTTYTGEREWSDEIDGEPRPRRRWPFFVALSVALCAVVLGFWIGRATASTSAASVDYSAVPVASTVTETVTATPKTSGARPRPTVTVWRTRTPAPRVVVSRMPVPGPTVRVTTKVTPKPVISRIPGPVQTCVITIEVEDGEEIDRSEDGAC